MAKLIPSFIDDHTPSGERDVFNMLANAPDEWFVIHSLDLSPWNRAKRTEIDFLAIVPKIGILCIEVKSDEDIIFDGTRWFPEKITRSPFKQACDGRQTFYRRLKQLAPELKHIPVVHCCIFTNSPFDIFENLSVQPWELMDARLFRSFNHSGDLCSKLSLMMKQSIEAELAIRPLSSPITSGQIDKVIKICLPVQKRHPGARLQIERRQVEIERLMREQQKPVLHLAASNKRVVVSGGAGTGKTFIAIEVALRAAENGLRVALLCFNQLVGDWMADKVNAAKPILPNLVTGRAIKIMAEMCGIEIPEKPTSEFWEDTLPQRIEELLTDPDFRSSAIFDYLVVDEAQDLLARPRLWSCLSQFLEGGFGCGSFVVLGDFDNQVFAEREIMEKNLFALDAIDSPSRWPLTENCRNYQIVGETALKLSGVSNSVYSGYMRSGGSLENYNISFYEYDEEQIHVIAQWIKDSKSQGYKPSEITLLSFRSDESSAANRLRTQGFKLRPAWCAGDFTGYSSVHSFKGMENKVIILTDVAPVDREFDRNLFYTGMTRATESVRVLCDKKCQSTLFGWLTGGNKT
jgi:hypothetical protein